jgi:hypothetical protein
MGETQKALNGRNTINAILAKSAIWTNCKQRDIWVGEVDKAPIGELQKAGFGRIAKSAIFA